MQKKQRTNRKVQRTKTSTKKASTNDLPVKDATGVKGGRKAGSEQQEYLKITMSDVIVS